MKFKVVMMQKNEELLLPVWIAYFSHLFGPENLYVFDNGSTLPAVISDLKHAGNNGVHVFWNHNTVEDFARKGDLIAEHIKDLDRTDPADFYFPLDCDEFTIVHKDGNYSCSKSALEKILRPHLGTQDVLMFGSSFDNYPGRHGGFVRKSRKKCFFAQDTCDYLDLGFHKARARNSCVKKPVRGIWQIHLHNKPLHLLKEHSRQKMIGRVPDFDRDTLVAHRDARGQGMHLIDKLLLDSEADYQAFAAEKYKGLEIVELPVFRDALRASGVELPY